MISVRNSVFIIAHVFMLLFCLVSNLLSQDGHLKNALQREYDLTLKYDFGDKDFYHIRTVYLEMNDTGKVAKTRLLDGGFSREVLRFKDSKRYDRFVWKHVKMGHKMGKSQVRETKVLPYSRDFRYEFSEKDMTPERFPVDVTSIPKTMEGYNFFVKLIDAHTFDVISNFANYEHGLSKIGQTAELPEQELQGIIDFPPLFTDTHFAQAPIFTTFQGITLYEGEPCAMLAYRSDDSRIHMTANMMDMKIPMDGTSYYWGEILMSLQRRKILRGTLFEHVVSITNLGNPAKPIRNVIRREITLEKVTQEEFENFGRASF
ncbi:hypothetical protein GWO43_18035 [candidate division KSB1 bacterium]|nr:hypothetical protein [candidate division KSB1 bacterium]NIS25858.1 hypothetical protein [candidate division KSB1 bacterium]NIT72735.1 hypothetical protein [candidate division KSB1 bacterium]NIU26547.1 hypothetical protein [candidate division KSB1 bacterium]NIU90989.1 hypothetical protein [candidate division KSB1 bacterium]